MPQEKMEELWNEATGEKEKSGPLFAARTSLAHAFTAARNFDTLPQGLTEIDETIISPIATFRVNKTPSTPQKNFEAKSRQTANNDIYVAIHQIVKSNKDAEEIDTIIYEYILNSNGTAVALDELTANVSINAPSETEMNLLERAAVSIAAQIESKNRVQQIDNQWRELNQVEEKKERRGRIARRIGGSVVTLAVVGGLGIGGYFGWNEWIHKPGIADDEYRKHYDQENHSINGSSIELDDQQMTIISAEEFADIPTYRGGDDLSHPRTARIDSSTGCVDLDTKNLKGVSVKVGVAEYNPLGAYPVIAYASDKTTLNVCAVGDISNETLDDDELTIAIQVTKD